MEHLTGVGMVAAQRYLASVCNWLSVSKDVAINWGPQKKGVTVASIVNAAANYWKHVEDGDAQGGALTPYELRQAYPKETAIQDLTWASALNSRFLSPGFEQLSKFDKCWVLDSQQQEPVWKSRLGLFMESASTNAATTNLYQSYFEFENE